MVGEQQEYLAKDNILARQQEELRRDTRQVDIRCRDMLRTQQALSLEILELQKLERRLAKTSFRDLQSSSSKGEAETEGERKGAGGEEAAVEEEVEEGVEGLFRQVRGKEQELEELEKNLLELGMSAYVMYLSVVV